MTNKQNKMRFEDFVDKTAHAKGVDELFDTLTQEVAKQGFDKVIFSVTYDGDLPKDKNKLGVFYNYPSDWQKYYEEKRYDLIDPVLKCAALYSDAFTWESLEKRLPLTAKQTKFMRQGEEAGLWNGVGVPMRGSRGQLSGIALASSEQHDSCNQNLDLLTAYCNQFYIAYKRLFRDESQSAPKKIVSLTPKESEILHWLAAGKTDEEISIITGNSKNTIDTHLRKIFQKLEVHNRVAAVVKGIAEGLVTP